MAGFRSFTRLNDKVKQLNVVPHMPISKGELGGRVSEKSDLLASAVLLS